jgi:outer membrane protein assembly factor BamB
LVLRFNKRVNDRNIGGAAYSPFYISVPCSNGLVALRIEAGTSFKVVWSSSNFFAGPPVVAGDTVLTIDTSGGNLYAFDAGTGNVVFKISLGQVTHFTTPSLS